jgi:hypothetical protein
MIQRASAAAPKEVTTVRTSIGGDSVNEQATRDPRSSERVAEAVRRALLLVGPAENAYDERPDEETIAELVLK